MKNIYLSVGDFAQPSPKVGSIEIYSGFREAAQWGIETHKLLQEMFLKDNPSYQSEVILSHTFHYQKIKLHVSGRLDGLYNEHEENLTIEEIKTALDAQKLIHSLANNYFTHPYWIQLQTYGYFYWLKNNKKPHLNLLVVCLKTKRKFPIALDLNISAYESWLNRRLDELNELISQAKKRIRHRKKLASQLVFPFKKFRKYQDALLDTVTESFKNKNPLLLQAPTGLGKTVTVLFPTLKDAWSRGQKTIYLTPKNSLNQEVKLTVDQLQLKKSSFKTLLLSAKKKLCMKDEPFCNSSYCEFARNHFTKVREAQLLQKLKREKTLDYSYFKKQAKRYEICPYELQMQSISGMDLVIGDYNYVFSPSLKNGRVSTVPLGEEGKPNLVIDEVHNLPARSLDYYSPVLSIPFLEKLIDSVTVAEISIQGKLISVLNDCVQLIHEFLPTNLYTPKRIEPPTKPFLRQLEKLNLLLSEYFGFITLKKEDPFLSFYQYWSNFSSALDLITQSSLKDYFFVWADRNQRLIKITCCDASSLLKDSYELFHQIVGFSATLKPFSYYAKRIGLEKAITAEFETPFEASQRKLLIIPQLSTSYKMRQRNYNKLIEVIQRITKVRPGNYLIFFPSFDYLDQVFYRFPFDAQFKLLKQERRMTSTAVQALLVQLEEPDISHLVFAVQGGMLSEGINYLGDLAIGVFIIGPPLPVFNWENEQIKHYYETHYQLGIEYMAIYPAMAKTIQAAGRIIRSEEDKGIIVLVDNRFLEKNYSECMPNDWYINTPQENVSQSILSDLQDFWEKSEAKDEL